MSYQVKRYHDISCGHRVHGHESKCAHLHGHNYRITFTCMALPPAKPARSFIGAQAPAPQGELDDIGRVIDFTAVKERLCMWVEEHWDHKFLIWERDPAAQALLDLDPAGVLWVTFNPTAENMARHLVEVIGPRQLEGTGVVLVACDVEETRKCSASYSL